MLIASLVCSSQRVKYDGPAVLRVDTESNPVASETVSASFKQETHYNETSETRQSSYAYVCYTHVLDLPIVVGSQDAPIALDFLHYLIYVCADRQL